VLSLYEVPGIPDGLRVLRGFPPLCCRPLEAVPMLSAGKLHRKTNTCVPGSLSVPLCGRSSNMQLWRPEGWCRNRAGAPSTHGTCGLACQFRWPFDSVVESFELLIALPLIHVNDNSKIQLPEGLANGDRPYAVWIMRFCYLLLILVWSSIISTMESSSLSLSVS
jgi:hypothetical protein